MANIVNLGSLCIDHVYQVAAIAGSGETISANEYQIHPGGKGLNQSLAAALAGATVAHAGCVGEDAAFLIELLAANGVDTAQIQTLPGASGHALIQVNPDGENAIVINGGTNRALTQEFIDQVLATLNTADWLLLQNEINELPYILQQAAARKLQVAINIAPPDAQVRNLPLTDIALLILNTHEAAALTAIADFDAMLNELIRCYPQAMIVVTCGSKGLYYRANTAPGFTQMPAFTAPKVVDETAAGDAFIGYLMAELVAGQELAAALGPASAAGALAVTKAGAASALPQRAAVSQFLTQQAGR